MTERPSISQRAIEAREAPPRLKQIEDARASNSHTKVYPKHD
jgi:hypothetical protein